MNLFMPIRYKVVSDRKSCMTYDTPKYCLFYEKDSIVEAKKETLGIFLFRTREDAFHFLRRNFVENNEILRVETLSKETILSATNYIGDVSNETNLNNFYISRNQSKGARIMYPGTILCHKIKVLD